MRHKVLQGPFDRCDARQLIVLKDKNNINRLRKANMLNSNFLKAYCGGSWKFERICKDLDSYYQLAIKSK
jgi:hypothetical protein